MAIQFEPIPFDIPYDKVVVMREVHLKDTLRIVLSLNGIDACTMVLEMPPGSTAIIYSTGTLKGSLK